MKTGPTAMAVLFVAGLAACSGGSKTSQDAPMPASASAACAQLHAARAQYDARCLGGTVAEWRKFADVQEDCAAYDRHVDEGTVVLRPQGWADCLAVYDQPCDKVLVESCAYEALHGLVADGEPCQDTEVCDTKSSCAPLGSGACGNICVRAGNLNEACGLYCGDSTPCYDVALCAPGLVCDDGTCAAGGAIGAACGGPTMHACGPNLTCQASTGTCAARAAGGPCLADTDCPALQFCDGATCAPRLAIGASCRDAPTGCAAWTTCDQASGTCVSAGAVGEPCAAYPGVPDYLTCAAGACSDGATCHPVAGQGQGCATAACATGLVCDSTTVTCLPCQ